MSSSVNENLWIVEVDDKIKRSDYDKLKHMEKRITLILLLGSTIKDFANHNLHMNLNAHQEEAPDALRYILTKFFHKPNGRLRALSLEVKSKILKIPKITNIDEIIDRFVMVFANYCSLVNDDVYEDYIEEKDITNLELLLKNAPCPQNYDEQLHAILVEYINKW